MHPTGYEPMLATASRHLVGDGWAFEPKLDGWRAMVHATDLGLRVFSRPGREITASVPHLACLTSTVPPGTVLDGELVAGSGRAWSFYKLSPHLRAGDAQVTFVAFDVLALSGLTLLQSPYSERRAALSALDLGPSACPVSSWVDADVSELLAACELQGVEGLVAKRVRSRYRPGRRSGDWVKVKTQTWLSIHAPRRMARR